MLDLLGHACASERESSNPGSGSPTEVWRAVVGYEGLYEVSSLGGVSSLDRVIPQINRHGTITKVLYRGRPLAQVTSAQLCGYISVAVSLYRGNARKNIRVSNLVAAAFLGPRPVGAEVARITQGHVSDIIRGKRWGHVL